MHDKLDTAYDRNKGDHKLEPQGDSSYEDVRIIFDEVIKAVEKRREEVLLDTCKRKKDEKKKVLERATQNNSREKLKWTRC